MGNQVINLIPPYVCIHAKGMCADLVAIVWLVLKENYPSRKVRMMVIRNVYSKDFPAGPVAKSPCSQYRGLGFDPWSGN